MLLFRSGRESYGDAGIGYVCLKRRGGICTVKADICPEHRINNPSYPVILIVDEENEKIKNFYCEGCKAAAGKC